MAFDFGAFGQAAATSAAQSVIGTGLGAIFAKRNIKLQNKQFAWQQDRTNQMNIQNMLNNAQYQKQSLLNAGLNPAMLSEGNYSSPVTAPTPQAKGSDIQASPMDIAGFMQANAQTKLAAAQAENIQADTKLKEIQAEGDTMSLESIQKFYQDMGLTPEVADSLARITYTYTMNSGQEIDNKFKAAEHQAALNQAAQDLRISKKEFERISQYFEFEKVMLPIQVQIGLMQAYNLKSQGDRNYQAILESKALIRRYAVQNAKDFTEMGKIIEETRGMRIYNNVHTEEQMKQALDFEIQTAFQRLQNIKTKNEYDAFINEYQQKYKEKDRTLNYIFQGIGLVCKVAGAVAMFVPGGQGAGIGLFMAGGLADGAATRYTGNDMYNANTLNDVPYNFPAGK